MHKALLFLGVLVMPAAACVFASTATAQTKLVFAHTLSNTSPYSTGAKTFAKKLNELSDGKYVVEESYGGSLGGERKMIEGTQLGTIDLVITSTGPVGNFVPETEILDIPFLFDSFDQAHEVLDGPLGQNLLDKFDDHGLHALAWAENGFRNITNSKHEIKTPADLKGLKLRTMENPVHIEAFKTLGALPTPMDFTELFTALEQGTVDGQENPLSVILHSNFAEVQKYLSLTRHVYSPAVILISPALWNSLPEEDQNWFMQAAKAGVKANREQVEQESKDGIKTLQDEGMQVTFHDDIDIDAFKQALEPAYTKYAKQFGQDNIDELMHYGE